MKNIRFMRHSVKQGSFIGVEGLALAQTVDATHVTDLFHSCVLRTAQTLLAIVASQGLKARIHPPIEEIGNPSMFEELATIEYRDAESKGHDSLTAFMMAFYTEKERKPFRDKALLGLKKMFDLMPDGGYGLAIGHDPFISLCAMACGFKAGSLQPLEFYDFEQDDDGTIRVITKD
ncbi:MAG: hypothetical protein NTX82_03020 [Candidatus Parcubacteria bacterium]|nr:hypothetical protein [Candidatus Parcubacteria bacterium]